MVPWISCVIFLFVLACALAIWVRPAVAFAVTLPLAWLFPAWVGIDVGPDLLNVKTTLGIALLVVYCLFPRSSYPWRLVPCDYAVLGLFAVGIVSDVRNDGFNWYVPASGYVEWIVPYLCGRLAFQSRYDPMWAWPVLSLVGLCLVAVAVFEAWTGLNPYEFVFGLRPLEGAARDVQRWNLRRAYGPCMHPLYFGVLLAWLFPWQIHAAWLGLAKRVNPIWIFPCVLHAFAPLVTGSRGPMLAVGIVLVTLLVIVVRRWRWPLLAATGCLIVALVANQERVLTMLDNWSGEMDHGHQLKELKIDEAVEQSSSARARLTLFKIYWAPLTKAGWIGYGTQAVTGFPVNVPIGSDQAQAARDVWALDNSYLLMTLRYGYAGLFCFLAIIGIAVWQSVRVYDADLRWGISRFTACLAATTVGVACLLFVVWMPAEIGFPFLWGIGASSGLYYQTMRHKQEFAKAGALPRSTSRSSNP